LPANDSNRTEGQTIRLEPIDLNRYDTDALWGSNLYSNL
jgi:hypothetical protein